MSQTKIYTLSEIQRINDSRVAIPGHRYTDNFGNVWVGTDYRRLQILSGSTAVWGNISGTLSDQSDLWLVLQSKQDLLVSGVNIKTINGNTLLGSGNIAIVGGVQSVTGLNTDNTDPLNPVVEISVDGVTITGDGTPGNPLVSTGGGVPNLSQVLASGKTANNAIEQLDYLDFDTAAGVTALEGQLAWNNTDGTLDLGLKGGLLNKIGQQVVVRARNNSGSAITKGSVVKVVGVAGGFIGINLALGDSDANSATAFGIVAEDIADASNGFVSIQGIVHGLNTNSFTEGNVLYLSPTVAGTFTNVKPVAPQHAVVVGYVAKKSATDGHILMHVQNGYELDELHNVQAQSPTLNDTLWYDNTVSPAQWKTASIPTILGYTPISSVTGTIGITIDGGGSAITTGVKGYIVVPNSRTITGWYVVGAPSGSIVVDVWKANGSIPTVANTITGTEKPTLSSSQYNSDLSLSTWTTALAANDVIVFNVDSATTITKATIVIVTTAP